jgi:hypothetical protein
MNLLCLIKSEKSTISTKIVQSNNSDTDTLKCPKCGAIWRAKGHFYYDDGGWIYDEKDSELCPNGCINFFGFRLTGRVV